ncbi:MAG: hypothetical protein E6G01_01550 [Actinobacteria bacterium]|nr:MAG: hypothetical protein E6G01_01550 [Actinomycetota bacterium]
MRRYGRDRRATRDQADGDGYDMSGWGVAAVAGGVAAALAVTVVLARLLAAVASLDRTTRQLVRAIDDVRRETVPLGNGGVTNGSAGSADAGGAPALMPGDANGRARLRPFDLGLVSPVIKARALGRGTSQAARQLRQRRER